MWGTSRTLPEVDPDTMSHGDLTPAGLPAQDGSHRMSGTHGTDLPTREPGGTHGGDEHREPSPTVVVLLEGRSDVAALRTLATARGIPTDGPELELVDMGGATNIRQHVRARLHPAYPSTLLGLCDVREATYFLRALRAEGLAVECSDDMAAHGFHVCREDLEDELIRAAGPAETLRTLHELGLGEQLETFTRQPAWRGRPLQLQLRRFAGTAAGRKATVDAALAASLSPTRVPVPLRRLLDQAESRLSPPL